MVKELPITNRETRQTLRTHLNIWQHQLAASCPQHLQLHNVQWNQPEGCASVISEFMNRGNMQCLVDFVGAIPESILKDITKQMVTLLKFSHKVNHMGMHGFDEKQILFTEDGVVKINFGLTRLLRSKNKL